MPPTNPSLWHALGRAFETAATSGSGGSTRSRAGGSPDGEAKRKPRGAGAATGLLAGGLTAAIVSGIQRFTRGHRPPVSRLARGAFAGAGAAGVVLLGRALLDRARDEGPSPDASPREVGDELLAGAGRGLLYVALLDPFLPGPPLVRGAIAGTADYFATPLGGLFPHLQSFSPVRRVPVLSILLETGDAEEDPFLQFLAYGAVLGLLLGEADD